MFLFLFLYCDLYLFYYLFYFYVTTQFYTFFLFFIPALSPGKCRFPSWLTGHTNNGLTWHTLDLTRSYTFYPRNVSLHVTRSNSSVRTENIAVDFQDIIDGQDEQDVTILCNSIKQTNPTQTVTMLIAHFTIGW